jgi:hypothetical protein
MALIPSNTISIGQDVEITTQPTYTYYLDIENKKIVRHTDGKEAMKQAIYKIIQTERYKYLIYDWNYGIELEGLIGKDPLFVLGELERIFSEALKTDDRITSISNFIVNQTDKSDFLVSFTANTTEGDIDIEGVEVSV